MVLLAAPAHEAETLLHGIEFEIATGTQQGTSARTGFTRIARRRGAGDDNGGGNQREVAPGGGHQRAVLAGHVQAGDAVDQALLDLGVGRPDAVAITAERSKEL